MSDDLRDLFRELNHWWMWLLVATVCAAELAAAAGWLPAGTPA
jgi:hypothetical protein